MKIRNYLLLTFFLASLLAACNRSEQQAEQEDNLSLDYEKYTLDNGLQVVLHEDHSDPIVAVAIMYHVGSNRERPGKTGFAHLFEHMLFQESEHVEQDQFFKKIQDAGGTLNGGTWQDGTVYYEVVPKNATEMVLWLESDRMGYFINTVTRSAFTNQQEVVQNEKRQRVDNRPYGHTNYVISKSLYPEGHPYNWQVIGELADLQQATVADVKEFYHRFYGPNNATLVIAGDFDKKEIKKLIDKYFGEIPKGAEVPPLPKQPVQLSDTIKLYHEDNFATLPQLNMVWPTVEEFHPDSYALDFLAELLSEGKKAPLYKVLVKQKQLSSAVSARANAGEIAGIFRIQVTANDGVDLDSVQQGIGEALAMFEQNGISDKDIERIKAKLETSFYNDISSVLGKSFQLARYNVFAGDPGFIAQDIASIKKVSKEDVMRVYEKYIKNKPFVLTSFVPKGSVELAVSGSEKARVVEEDITRQTAESTATAEEEEPEEALAATPSSFDRSVEPPKGPAPELKIPQQWEATLTNGMQVYGIEQDELPLVEIRLIIKGGHWLDKIEKNGVANLMSDIMMEGTANKTPEELEEAIDLLGADIYMYTDKQSIVLSANCLARNFEKTMALIEEMMLQPRWDEEELALIKTRTINQIKRQEARPYNVADKVYNRLLYGKGNIFGYPITGNADMVEQISMDDLKAFYQQYFSPTVTSFLVAGKVNKERVLQALNGFEQKWPAKEVNFPDYPLPDNPDKARLYFVDIPNAKQSVINIGYLALKRTDPDYYPAVVMNYKLGGSFNSRINMILREEKGYTYGARSYFASGLVKSPFTATSSVRTNVTYESVKIFKEEMENYRQGISPEDLEFTKNAMIKSNARRFETLSSLVGMLRARSLYGLPADYVKQQEDIIRNMTLEQHKALAQKYIVPAKMNYLVVGDAATQFGRFKEAVFDQVMLIDREGQPVEETIAVDMMQ